MPDALTVDLPPDGGFDWHTHDHHQLALAARGVLVMGIGDTAWVLPRSRALWVPAGTRHCVTADGETRMVSVYVPPARCPVGWAEPTVVDAHGLCGELVLHLGRADLDGAERRRGEAVLWDVMRPVAAAALTLPMPSDERARRVADAIVADVTDARSLAEWGRAVGASERTLARLFAAETGMSFARWRTNARLAVALRQLAGGVSASAVAHRVGYATPSAFVAAFRREIGTTPARYFS
jgi:AraC-like DNA-binding protein